MLGRSKDGGRTPEERAAAAEDRARRRGGAPPPMNHMQPPPPLEEDPEDEPGEPDPASLEAPPPPPAPPPTVTRRVLPGMPAGLRLGDPEPVPAPGLGSERLGPRPAPIRPRQETEDRPIPDLGPLTPPAYAQSRKAPDSGRVPDEPRAAPPLRRSRGAGAVLRRRTPGTPPPPRTRRNRPTGGGFAGRRIAAGLAVLLVLILLFVADKTFQPFHGDPTGLVKVTIPEGANFSSISGQLAKADVIDSKSFFSLNATITGRRGDLHPGTYTLQHGMSYGAVLEALTKGPKAAPPPETFKVTLAEGQSIKEIAKKDTGTTGSYAAAANSKTALKRAYRLGLPKTARTTEGFLFPATYDLVRGATAENLIDQQLQAYADNTGSVDYAFAKKKNLTRYDVLIIASMVEREAQLDTDRPLIASVIYNRLKNGTPLGIDATLRYYENNWTDPLTVSQLAKDEPYNTRIKRGLPPTPIGNPGLKSIEAAAHPAKTNYLFFVVKPCGDGAHAFSSTDAQFQRDQAKYNSARNANGGKSPANC